MIVAYLRVSTGRQNPENQKDEIQRFALEKNWEIDRWVTEIVSGKKSKEERKLGYLLKTLKKGDVLLVTEVSRLSRTLTDIMSIMGVCLKKGIHIYTTKERYVFDDTINSKVLCFAFGLVAEIERNLISLRTKEALALKRSEGVILGRRKGSCVKLNYLLQNSVKIENMIKKEYSISKICRVMNVSRDTYYKYKKFKEEGERQMVS